MASLIELPTQSGFQVSVAARKPMSAVIYQPKGFEKNSVRFDAGFERVVWDGLALGLLAGSSLIRAISSAEARFVLRSSTGVWAHEGHVRGESIKEVLCRQMEGSFVSGCGRSDKHASVRTSAHHVYQIPGDPSP